IGGTSIADEFSSKDSRNKNQRHKSPFVNGAGVSLSATPGKNMQRKGGSRPVFVLGFAVGSLPVKWYPLEQAGLAAIANLKSIEAEEVEPKAKEEPLIEAKDEGETPSLSELAQFLRQTRAV